MKNNFEILLYYKYVPLKELEAIRISQRELCERLNILGRIIISDEGINGTVCGDPDSTRVYMAETMKIPGLEDIEWKISESETQVFPKLKILVREEIVTLGIKKTGNDVQISKKADYIEPHDLLKMYEENKDFVIIDARNIYEAEIGKFKDAIVAPINNFREFPEFVKEIEKYKDSEVVTYCTGGVRCEKASAYLRENGFKKVRQLHGGIHEYGEKVGGKHFQGEMFVFDARLHIPVNKINPEVLTSCIYCGIRIARYVDCSIPSCDNMFICCEECEIQQDGLCSENCKLAYSTVGII